MKLIIASDIHGSVKYTKKLEELIIKENPDKIILLGDFVYYASTNQVEEFNTVKCLNILNKYKDKIIAIRGNCDIELSDNFIDFNLNEEYQIINIDGIPFYLTHGHLINKYAHIFENNYLISGHTHIYNLSGKHLNPGSVGLPRMNKEHACIIYDNHLFKLINLEDFSTIEEVSLNEE